MLSYIVALILIGFAASQFHDFCSDNGLLHTTCHNNAHYAEAQVITLVANILDRNHDGFYSEAEGVVGFAEILHKTLPFSESTILSMTYQNLLSLTSLSGFSITKHEFTQQWHFAFHDSQEFAAAVFECFDTNRNGVWSIQEVDNIFNIIKRNFDNGDGVVIHTELEAFFNHVYGC